MNYITKMSIVDKITLLNEIKKNQSTLKKQWSNEKVEWLERLIILQLKILGSKLNP